MFNRLEPDTLPCVLSIEPPRSIGPYQVLRSLGVGGMGEVFLAFDPRLKRQVAIKRIRPDVAQDPERQARFKREAELAAGLNHASIVQVHDLLTDEGTDHIVMEYVAGSSLRRWLRDSGALSPPQGLSIALALARGLEYAHGTGVVHRDLKSENVLLTPQGEPKITDFGIAFRALSKDSDVTLDAPLTQEGALLGTFRAMSPEQLVGDPVDASSDLFSFGVLLYELFTAQSPFLAATHRETMQRVLHQDPTPVHEIAPDVPPVVSELIGDLLDKDPLMRPRDAREVVQRLRMLTGDSQTIDSRAVDSQTIDAGVTLVGGTREIPERPSSHTGPINSGKSTYGGAGRSQWGILALVVLAVLVSAALAYRITTPPKPEQLLYVAVTKPQSTAAPENPSELLSFAIRSGALRALLSLDGVAPKTTDDVDDEVLDGATDLARAVGADEVITSSFTCQARNCWVELRRVKVDDDTVLWSDEAEVPRDNPLLVSQSISVLLRGAYPSLSLRSGIGELSVLREDYLAFLEIREEFDNGGGGTAFTELLERIRAIRQSSDQFVDAYLLEVRISLSQYSRMQDPALFDEASRLIRRARELAPGNPNLLHMQCHAQIITGQLEQARATVEELEELVPGRVENLELQARIFKLEGRPEQALEVYRLAAERRPSADMLFNYAKLAFQQGDTETARQALEDYRQLLPNSWSGRRLLATVELSIGDPNRAVELCQELIEQFEDPIDFSNLGLAHMLLGQYNHAAEAFQEAVEAAPNSHTHLFNLADTRWLQGRESEAEALYRRVITLIDERGAKAPQHFTVRAQALAHLNEGHQAVAAIQEALRGAPGNRDIAFEAALVFALVGDHTMAVFHAQEAIQSGYPSRWFQLPWFDDLKSDPAFKRLIDH